MKKNLNIINNNKNITTIIIITILRHLISCYFLCLSGTSRRCFGLPTIKPLPKHPVHELTTKDFDSIYWDKRPVILTGATACPHIDFNLSDIPSCYKNAAVSGRYVHTKFSRRNYHDDKARVDNNKDGKKQQEKPPPPPWAGLQPGNSTTLVAINEFVRSMLNTTTHDDDNNNNASSTSTRRRTTPPQRFMFDVPMVEICPAHLDDVRLPPHFIDRFASQFQYGRQQRPSTTIPSYCDTMPFFNLYLSDANFETDLHVDAGHAAFVASMCAGRKLWRVLTPETYAAVHHLIGDEDEGRVVNGTWVMSDVRRPFATWTDDDDEDDVVSLRSLNESVVVYEGVLKPGEILYIPPGAPHAATTLDPSWMVASNDRSVRSMGEVVGYCDAVRRGDDEELKKKEGRFCRSSRRRWDAVWYNYRRYGSAATPDEEDDDERRRQKKRSTTEMSFAEAFHCEESFKMLTQSRLEITHDNLLDEVYDRDSHRGDDDDHHREGILVMKYFKGCIHCLVFLKQVLGTTTSNSGGTGRRRCDVRLGFVSCPDGECLNLPHEKNNDEYQKMVRLVRRTSPEFVFVTPRSSRSGTTTLRNDNDERHRRVVRGGGRDVGGVTRTTTTANDDVDDTLHQRRGIFVSHYYGPMNVDILRVWIGMKTKCHHIPDAAAVDDDGDADGPSVWWTFIIICYLFYLEFIAMILEQGMGIPPTANDVMVVSIISLVVFLIPLVGLGINGCFVSCQSIYLKDYNKRKSE